MNKIKKFTLSKEQIEVLKKLENNKEYRELKMVSGLETISCPYCRGGGCYGSCQMTSDC